MLAQSQQPQMIQTMVSSAGKCTVDVIRGKTLSSAGKSTTGALREKMRNRSHARENKQAVLSKKGTCKLIHDWFRFSSCLAQKHIFFIFL